MLKCHYCCLARTFEGMTRRVGYLHMGPKGSFLGSVCFAKGEGAIGEEGVCGSRSVFSWG